MFVNNFKINLSLMSGATATTINIPINMEYQLIDQSELIDRVFVSTEVENSINPIIDYEKTRFSPINNNNKIGKVTYILNLNGKLTYGDIGFTDDDIRFDTEKFKQSFLNLLFYDSDNPLTQNLLSFTTLYCALKPIDIYQVTTNSLLAGKPKPVSQIFLTFVVENPIINPRGVSQGYYLYDFKDEFVIGGLPKKIYMKAMFKNAKTGKSINLMTNSSALPIDQLIKNLYTKYDLVKTTEGYFYQIDSTYSTNVSYSSNDVTVNLYEILAT
jgi:hypothetical protein